jgi:hypothetical protein
MLQYSDGEGVMMNREWRSVEPNPEVFRMVAGRSVVTCNGGLRIGVTAFGSVCLTKSMGFGGV